MKQLFLCPDSKRVQHSTPQVDLDDSKMKFADGTISVEPEPGCQTRSDQLRAALQSPSVQVANPDSATPALSHLSDSSDLEIGLDCGESLLPLFRDISALCYFLHSAYHYLDCKSDTLTSLCRMDLNIYYIYIHICYI